MNAVIALCTFCEMHGPKVIFATQTYRTYKSPESAEENNEKLKFYGPKDVLRHQNNSDTSSCDSINNQRECEGCKSLGNIKYLSNEHETRTSFLSAQQPLTQDIGNLVKHACVR